MAFLDVTEVIEDPDFADELICTRSVETVGSDGNTVLAATTSNFWGVVTNESGDVIERTDSASQVHGTIIIHTLFILTMAGPNTDADHVTWEGVDYLVKDVKNYSHFGRGFVAATCSIQPLAGA
jgi:hypothetical protein